MNNDISSRIADKLNFSKQQVAAVLQLFEEGATVPFIARYRKDRTGNLDEVQIIAIKELHKDLQELQQRKIFILKTIEEQGKLTDELNESIAACEEMALLEDIYLPYKPKRKTKAQAAREKGLEPLATAIFNQTENDVDAFAGQFINAEVSSQEDAIKGARDIIAEWINEDADCRAELRKLFENNGSLTSKVLAGKEEEGVKFKDYFDYEESIKTIPSHRAMAVFRGFLQGILRMSIAPDQEVALSLIETRFISKPHHPSAKYLKQAAKDSYTRLLGPSLESECRMQLNNRCNEEAIQVFADNLRQLLLSSPLGSKAVMAIDPGYRTGCKIVCLDAQGNLQHTDIIYLHHESEAISKISSLLSRFRIDAFAIGDGTGGRETQRLIAGMQTGKDIFMVNEDGASVYSVSEVAREEFPEQDVTVRGAVSIGRRLMDPLAELVKIDPKSIGVGQYQHDVNQLRLKEKLDQTVESCVNNVGVNVNTASKHLLQYVSGIGDSLAKSIVDYRKENGAFRSRSELKKVPRLGDKAFEQCAGFLRIPDAHNPLDTSTIHPEQYECVELMAKDLQLSVTDLIGNEKSIAAIKKQSFEERFGKHTINDILKELRKPGIDPRKPLSSFRFAEIYSIEEVIPGMILPGKVTNLTQFGAFVDIGVKQDGLVHISEITNRFIKSAAEVLKLGDEVQVLVLETDVVRKRISLSIKQANKTVDAKVKAARPQLVKNAKQNASLDDALQDLKQKFRK